MNNGWSPDSWQTKPVPQKVAYPDQPALRETLAALGRLPPLVTSWEVAALKGHLADACH